jgi:hypothetical protein
MTVRPPRRVTRPVTRPKPAPHKVPTVPAKARAVKSGRKK